MSWCLSGRREAFAGESHLLGPEVVDDDLLHFPAEVLPVLVSKTGVGGTTIKQLRQQDYMHGIFIRSIRRADIPVPVMPDTKIDRGDVLELAGAKKAVDKAVIHIGYADRPTNKTDMMFVGLGIVIWWPRGRADHPYRRRAAQPEHQWWCTDSRTCIRLAPFTTSYIRAAYLSPHYRVMNNVGLNLFIAVVGITTGAQFRGRIQTGGNKSVSRWRCFYR